MLPKKNRLPIKNFPRRGLRSFYSKTISLRIFDSRLPFPRFGIVVSGKVVKGAVARNRLKRSFFNAVKTIILSIKPLDYLFIINKEVVKEALKEEVEDILKPFYV